MSYADRDGFIWLDGEVVPWREAKVHVLTHTLHYGLGVFEGIRAYVTDRGPAVFRLDDHLERLAQSMKILKMKIAFDEQTLRAASIDMLKRNNLQAAYIRPMSFYGSEGVGLHSKNLTTHTMIATWPWGEYLGDGAIENGIRVKTSSILRHHGSSVMVKAKCNGYYVNSMLALQEAQAAGYDEGLMLDHQGYVAEGSGENFFIVRSGKVITPPPGAILEGITRNTVLQLLQDAKIPCEQRYFTRDEVYIADEAFFTGTAAEITPIKSLDDRQIGMGKPGPITQCVQQLYFDCVNGKIPQYHEWLTFIEE